MFNDDDGDGLLGILFSSFSSTPPSLSQNLILRYEPDANFTNLIEFIVLYAHDGSWNASSWVSSSYVWWWALMGKVDYNNATSYSRAVLSNLMLRRIAWGKRMRANIRDGRQRRPFMAEFGWRRVTASHEVTCISLLCLWIKTITFSQGISPKEIFSAEEICLLLL